MTTTEAHAILTEATKRVDFMNLGGICSQLGEQGFAWGKFNNAGWRYDYKRAFEEMQWLVANASNIFEAMRTLKLDK